MEFLSSHQEKLQGKYNIDAEFATTTGGTTAYYQYLFRIPIAVTINEDTKNRDYLQPGKHDWLGNPENRVLIELKESPFVRPGAETASSSSAGPPPLALDGGPSAPAANQGRGEGSSTEEGGASGSNPAASGGAGATGGPGCSGAPAIVRQLQALSALKREGALSAEEFATAKKKVLGT